MDTTQIQLYEFNELPYQAKYHAIAEYGQPPDDWHEEIIQRAKEEGPQRASTSTRSVTGFHSQGDGASWTGFVDLATFIAYHVKPEAGDFAQYTVLAELIKDGWCEGHVVISRSGFYYNHSGTMRSAGVDDRIHYAEDDSVVDRGILEGANVKELARSIDTDYLFNQLDEWLLSKAQKYADEIYKQLREEYDAYTSDEYFKELCDINGWRFDKRGILINEE